MCKDSNIDFLDAANEEVIDHTRQDVKNCVRFYYKEKTPTLYKNEGIKEGDYSHRIIIKSLTSDNIAYDKNISFSNGSDLKRHGQIRNLPNNKLRFTYYMNGILSIVEKI